MFPFSFHDVSSFMKFKEWRERFGITDPSVWGTLIDLTDPSKWSTLNWPSWPCEGPWRITVWSPRRFHDLKCSQLTTDKLYIDTIRVYMGQVIILSPIVKAVVLTLQSSRHDHSSTFRLKAMCACLYFTQSVTASQITGNSTVYSTACSD